MLWLRSRLPSIALLCPDLNERFWLQGCKHFLQPWHERQQNLKLVVMRIQLNNCDRKIRDVLLIRKILVNGDECVELRRGKDKQCSIPYSAPTHLDRSLYGMRWQGVAQTTRYGFVKQ